MDKSINKFYKTFNSFNELYNYGYTIISFRYIYDLELNQKRAYFIYKNNKNRKLKISYLDNCRKVDFIITDKNNEKTFYIDKWLLSEEIKLYSNTNYQLRSILTNNNLYSYEKFFNIDEELNFDSIKIRFLKLLNIDLFKQFLIGKNWLKYDLD